MGQVYLAQDTLLDREVALKRIQPVLALDEEFVSRFQREARAISRIAHPGIVSVHSLDWIDGTLLLDMEYVRGSSVGQVMASGVVTSAFVASIAHDVLDALSECHDQGIIHRDIKPSNILLTETLRAKLVDFGIATALAESAAAHIREGRSTTVALGTPRYMPPEAWDELAVTPQWDLFALGVVLYECLSSARAYSATTTSGLAKQITNEALPPISSRAQNISLQLASVVDGLVRIRPDERFSSASEAMERLLEAPEIKNLADGTTHVEIPRLRNRIRSGQRARRAPLRRLGVIASALVTVCLLGGLTYWFMANNNSINSKSPQVSPEDSSNALVPPQSSDASDRFMLATALGESGEPFWHLWESYDSRSNLREIFGFSKLSVFRASSQQVGETIEYEGEWAGFGSFIGRPFREGRLSGTGKRQSDSTGLVMKLEFESSSERTSTRETYLVAPDTTGSGREQFLRLFEDADLLPSLLYNELLPRTSKLGRDIDSLLPAAKNQRVMAPYLSFEDEPVVDGNLDEELWFRSFFDERSRIGELAPVTAKTGMSYWRYSEKGLFIGARVKAPVASGRRFRAGVLMGVARPAEAGPRVWVEVAEDESPTCRSFEGDREIPCLDGWQAAMTTEGSTCTVEMFFPFITKQTDSSSFVAPWRANLELLGGLDSAQPKVVTRWGDDDGSKLAHGAIIGFSTTREVAH